MKAAEISDLLGLGKGSGPRYVRRLGACGLIPRVLLGNEIRYCPYDVIQSIKARGSMPTFSDIESNPKA